MELVDFIECMGNLLYGKGRFFKQGNGAWYDRKWCDYVTLETVLERIYEECAEELDW